MLSQENNPLSFASGCFTIPLYVEYFLYQHTLTVRAFYIHIYTYGIMQMPFS